MFAGARYKDSRHKRELCERHLVARTTDRAVPQPCTRVHQAENEQGVRPPSFRNSNRLPASSLPHAARTRYNLPYAVSITNAHPPRRIVSLQPSVTVILDRLNSLDLLVACACYCQAVCAEVNDGSRLIVKDSWSSQSAEILAAQPDLVIASVPYQAASLAEILKTGTPVLALAPHNLADIYRDIAMIAGIIGRFERAEAVIGAMQAEIEQIRRTASQAATRPKVFCEEWVCA
jgi:ABC-type Fe3+-hydroxamate transport system substrate-binding protein